MNASATAGVFCHPVDLVDDLPATLDSIAGIAVPGCGRPTGVALASAYHSSRDYLPRNRRRVHYSPAGLAFPPDPSLYPAGLPPPPRLPVCDDRDVLVEAVAAGSERGMDVDAWVVYLHHDDPRPWEGAEGRVVNAFGDVYPVALCPAAPIVGDYAEALTRDVAARGPRRILAEGLHHQPFAHGFHHERMFGQHGGQRRFLLGLCFCRPCLEAAARAGVDAEALRAEVRRAVDSPGGRLWLSRRDTAARLAAADLPPGSLLTYLRLRDAATTSLVRRCAAAAEVAGVDFGWLDATHAWAEEHAAPATSEHPGWQIGCDLAGIGRVSSVVTACYGSAGAWVTQLEESGTALGRMPDGVVLRALCASEAEAAELVARVEEAVRRGVGWVGLYHYGLAPMPLDSIFGRGGQAAPPTEGDAIR